MLELSSREQEIFDLLISGASPKEIGSKLNISFHTVKFHQKKLYQKLGVNSINELIRKYPQGNKEPSDLGQLSLQNKPVFHETAKRGFPLQKILVPLVTALGFFLIFHYSQKTANTDPIVSSAMEQLFPADFTLTLHKTALGAEYFFDPDVFYYNNESYASPFKLGEGNRLTEGDIYQVNCSFTPNVDLDYVHFEFLDSTMCERGHWTMLSGTTEFRNGYKANTRHDFSVKMLVTQTASSAYPAENLFRFSETSPAQGPHAITFHQFEVRKLPPVQKKPGETIFAQELSSPLVITFEDVEGPHWAYNFSYGELLNEDGISPFKLGSGNRITEDDIYQISCTFTSNVDMDILDISFVDTTRASGGNWIRLSPILFLGRNIKAGEVNNITTNLLATRTASGASNAANRIYMFVNKTTEDPPVLTFTMFEIAKIN